MKPTKGKTTGMPKANSVAVATTYTVTPEERYRMIAEAAYYIAERCGFTGGDVAADWLAAEAEIDRILQQEERHEIEQQVQLACKESPAAIADRVRAITLQALSGGKLDIEAMKRVVSSVVAGAHQGAERAEHRAQVLKEAMRGLDDALASVAEATQLAIQEAAGRSSEFSGQVLKKTMDDLAALELLFIETLADAAESAAGVTQVTLLDLVEHACASGTAVGGQVKLALPEITHAATKTTRKLSRTGTQTLHKDAALLASLAAGMLKGIAERLQSTSADKSTLPSSVRGS